MLSEVRRADRGRARPLAMVQVTGDARICHIRSVRLGLNHVLTGTRTRTDEFETHIQPAKIQSCWSKENILR